MLGADLSPEQCAVLGLMLGLYDWRALVREGGLEQGAAVEVAVQAIECVGRGWTGAATETDARP